MLHASILSSAEAEQLCRALSQCKACQTLENIDIASSLGQDSSGSLTAIRQFLCFTQLRSLRLSVHSSIYLDNGLLSEAMSSWPHMVFLELTDLHCCPPTVTFRGLLAALRLCPHLHTLRLSMDAVNIDIDPKVESFQHTSLQTLDVGPSPAEDAEAITCIISSMLPCLSSVHCRLESGSHLVWEEVNTRLELFAALDWSQEFRIY
ncbi:hypothetical protein K503DRAFT_801820 [Rhizopogon vinicolor AM-OR11-026]|uniref:F-box domain-containing protein n=1 Tax=Rhizopogon vinicolor AM-OR11-026 TaxID=1314800 RepID=A0A1B7MVX2_9AGAM|nr:hypothetical protein K503DRAFT_801820 [Rhizopogon vinicolor AM-OR11-026]